MNISHLNKKRPKIDINDMSFLTGKIINFSFKENRNKTASNSTTNFLNYNNIIKSKSAKKFISNPKKIKLSTLNIRKKNNNSNFHFNNPVFNNLFKNKTNNNNNIKNINISTNINNNNNNNNNNNLSNNNISPEIYLAKEIIQFIDDMKNLQSSICKKDPNIKELKKNFEKKKINLYNEALRFYRLDLNNRSFSSVSLFSQNSSITPNTTTNTLLNSTTVNNNNNINNSNQIKELTETINVLKNALDDIKINSQFITNQLKSEISNLNNKILKQNNNAIKLEKNILNQLNSIRNIYKLIKPYSNNFLNSNQSQSSIGNITNSNESKFEWYENEIKKIINSFEDKKTIQVNNITSSANNNNNNNNSNFLSSDKIENNSNVFNENKILQILKNSSNDIIDLIKPFLKDDEIENDFNDENCLFDSKDDNNNTNLNEKIVVNSINILKKFIKNILKKYNIIQKENENFKKEINESKAKIEVYKTILDNTVNKIKKKNNNNNIKNKDCENNNNNNKNKQNNKDLLKKMTNDFLSIQNELLSKLELKEIENEKNLTTINELLQINKNDEISKQIIIENGDTSTNSVSNEKYKVLLNLYTNAQELIKQLKNDYLNLIQNLGNYLENGNKINLDFNKINQIYFNFNKRTENNNFEDEMDSIELGRINENDLLTDKNSTLSNKRIDSKDSNSINIFLNNNNLVSKNKINNNNKQINNLKLDLKKYKNDCEKLKKKLNDANDILITVTNALIKLLNEVNLNNKIKDLFTLIFRLLNYTEEKINKLFSEKEKNNNNNNKK